METKTEFVIPQSHQSVLEKAKDRVQTLFDVCVVLANLVADGGGKQWIQVTGQYEQTSKAKEYILSLCDPQYKRTEKYPPELDAILRKRVDYIEHESRAAISFSGDFTATVRGTDINVMTACSLMEKEINDAQNGIENTELSNPRGEDYCDSSQSFSHTPYIIDVAQRLSSEDCRSPGSTSKDSDYNTDPEDEPDGGFSDNSRLQKLPDGEAKIAVSRTCSDQTWYQFQLDANVTTDPDGSPVSSLKKSDHYSANVDFATKLGYTEQQVLTVLDQLGPEADKNDLLGALVKMAKIDNDDKFIPHGGSPTVGFETLDDAVIIDPQLDESSNLRAIVIDGSNVAMSHGNKEVFSCQGIAIVVDWFLKRGHTCIKVFVPQWRKEASKPETPITGQEILTQLEKDHILVWTPSRRINGRRVVCYDDRYVLKSAMELDAIIVSNDNFRDLQSENPEWKKMIEERLLMYTFVDDTFMPPDDPLGRHGPSLDNFLRKTPTMPESLPAPCPYGRKCTYGNKCKYYHAERPHNQKSMSDRLQEQAKTRRELRARGTHESAGRILSAPGEQKKVVSPQNSNNIPEKKYAQMYKEINVPKRPVSGTVSNELRPESEGYVRKPVEHYEPYSEFSRGVANYHQPQGGYIRGPMQYRQSQQPHTVPLVGYVRPQEYHSQQLPHTVDLAQGYVREPHPHRYMDRQDEVLMNKFRQMKLRDHSDYMHNGNYGYGSRGYSKEEYHQHAPLSRQQSYQHPDVYGQMHSQGQPPAEYMDHQGHANVTRMRSFPVEGAIPQIREPRPNMMRQNSTSDPQIYQDDERMLRTHRGYYPEMEPTHWSSADKLYSGPPTCNGGEQIPWPGPKTVRAPKEVISRSRKTESPKKDVLSSGPPFPPGDARLFVFYNLSSIFQEKDILQAMRRHPEERDPQKLCGFIINKN
ncbi:NEDD4-binding protein 1-like [Saccoglossus kowalevskii]|uniref:Probable ribonuclease ZC3H12B-like n=1 Tax=Saccoglossus kowalevskii TaxID=10224 RepID=A0ABM0GZF9_SACKO|nr:PREDICTED: probable ribonuclease ZC3H12B-like [Saccoglossus kowalevskii]